MIISILLLLSLTIPDVYASETVCGNSVCESGENCSNCMDCLCADGKECIEGVCNPSSPIPLRAWEVALLSILGLILVMNYMHNRAKERSPDNWIVRYVRIP